MNVRNSSMENIPNTGFEIKKFLGGYAISGGGLIFGPHTHTHTHTHTYTQDRLDNSRSVKAVARLKTSVLHIQKGSHKSNDSLSYLCKLHSYFLSRSQRSNVTLHNVFLADTFMDSDVLSQIISNCICTLSTEANVRPVTSYCSSAKITVLYLLQGRIIFFRR